MEEEGNISASRGRPDKDRWDEYSILNDSSYKGGVTDKGNSLEWKSFEKEECVFSEELPEKIEGLQEEEGSREKKKDWDGEIRKGNDNPIRPRKYVASNTEYDRGEKGSPTSEEAKKEILLENLGVHQNISKQRYEEHIRKLRAASDKYTGEGEEVEDLVGARKAQTEKEENMRRALKIQENDLWIKDQEIVLLREKVARLEMKMEIEGKEYIEKCIQRGEAAVKILEEEMKKERRELLERIGQETEKSRVLSRRVEGLKKIINELVRKIKRMKQRSEG
ncbi:uncharacterized protein Eint_091060 [Encephalitozoon intestinalis ATCC 50506]|uniref:Uncharacterized protein n=1 Tax=Encephalitozoon intestinalis (strain ATCC 50506) TaxID=876142 RepID=E0S8W9_ENCIT|nr:uncharacterized protein Eint_091060 [Encephalitozoon intestinalis ATCC 50506]ADM12235.1 hypothetical protein Eint_091060 [Encephalitozoon intestinalis ATCC 50506]UTX46044.1 hypothetical protein GPK93_09g16300 [Encephalitozoon intestinalis]